MKTARITIRLPVDVKEKIEQEAERKGYHVSDIVLFAIDRYLQDVQDETLTSSTSLWKDIDLQLLSQIVELNRTKIKEFEKRIKVLEKEKEAAKNEGEKMARWYDYILGVIAFFGALTVVGLIATCFFGV